MGRGVLEEKVAEGEAEDAEEEEEGEGEEGGMVAPEPRNTAVRLFLDSKHFKTCKLKPPMKLSLI